MSHNNDWVEWTVLALFIAGFLACSWALNHIVFYVNTFIVLTALAGSFSSSSAT